jgi:hypothetical protein
MAKFRAPAGNGEVLAVPDFAAVPALVDENRRKLDRDDVTIGGLTLKELRALARREVLELAHESFSSPSPLVGEGGLSAPADKPGEGSASTIRSAHPSPGGEAPPALSRKGRGREDIPLLIAGHQPELAHPGVWVKNFALCGLAKKLGGTGLHLVVDNDTVKSTALRFPVIVGRGPRAYIQALAFDQSADGVAYEYATVGDGSLFNSFADRAAQLVRNWPFTPLLRGVWPKMVAHSSPWLGDRFAAARRSAEREWGGGICEVQIQRLVELDSFQRFVRDILEHSVPFAEVYNSAVSRYREINCIQSQGHPVPNLTRNSDWVESPFWGQHYGGYHHALRGRLFAKNDGTHVRVDEGPGVSVDEAIRTFRIRPRALTLTLFARVCLGDFFIHGIGGGKYDEVTDAIIRDYFHIEPPAYQVLSATLHLPLPGFPTTPDDLKRAESRVRDLHWNPQRHLAPENLARPEVQALVERKAALAAAEPPRTDHAARREWFRQLQRVTEELGPFVAKQEPVAEAELARVRAEVAANEVLRRRDYAWVLYPEETLRPFLQRFLDVDQAFGCR